MRNVALIRVLRLLKVIKGRRVVHLKQLADDFGVHERTIRRDLQALAAAGWKVPHGNDKDMSV